MSNMMVTLQDGQTITLLQVLAINEVGAILGAYEWHKNDCGCCVTVHPKGDHHRGYIIDSDGGYEWMEVPHAVGRWWEDTEGHAH